jgi:DNA-binding transcriptional regulator LsrR (DeoR family)
LFNGAPELLAQDHLQQLALAARLYYEDGKTQEEIAGHLGVSRPKVSRMLQQAREEGVVQITILDPFATDTKLAAALCKATGLDRAVVVPGAVADPALARRRLGRVAGRCLAGLLQPGDVLGVGWGRTLHEVAATLDAPPCAGLMAVPLLGGFGQIAPSFQVQELTRRIAQALGGGWRQLYAPAIVEDGAARRPLLDSPDVQAIVSEWGRLKVALVGIGNALADGELQSLFAAYLNEATLARLRAAHAVGDVCMRFYDGAGRPLADGLRGVIGIELEQLRQVPRVIAVAGGAGKAEAILGALRGGYVDVLVTDEAAAREMLQHTGQVGG